MALYKKAVKKDQKLLMVRWPQKCQHDENKIAPFSFIHVSFLIHSSLTRTKSDSRAIFHS